MRDVVAFLGLVGVLGCWSSDGAGAADGGAGASGSGGSSATGGASGTGASGGSAGTGAGGGSAGTGAGGGSAGTGAGGGTGGSAGASGSGGASAAEPAGLEGITQAHNDARAAEGANLPPLTWDPALAAIAQAWADTCTDVDAPAGLLDHNANRSDTYPEYVGENIYASSGTAQPQSAVDTWMSEKPNYDLSTGSCTGSCGHYTQVVWKATTKLGCGLSNCAGLAYPHTIVCDYAPGGNNGGKPY